MKQNMIGAILWAGLVAAGCGPSDLGGFREYEGQAGEQADTKASSGKVDICHYPSNGSVIVISVSANAVPAHFDNHGDHYLITYYGDADGDGHGAASDAVQGCVAPAGYVEVGDDCDDADAANFPGNTESCDGQDNTCDGAADEGFDVDGDGVTSCGGDCDDGDAANFPGNTESCDGQDNTCDGAADEGFDVDGDGVTSCGGDCDDDDAANFPGNTESCDGQDNTCDGTTDEGCVVVPPGCVEGTFGGHTYVVCQGSQTHAEAITACDDLGLNLSYISTEEENTFVVDLAYGAFGCTSYTETSYWIANLKSQTASTWPDGTPVWASGEPNGDGNNVHIMRYCGEIYGWNDVPTSYRWGWVCESDGGSFD